MKPGICQNRKPLNHFSKTCQTARLCQTSKLSQVAETIKMKLCQKTEKVSISWFNMAYNLGSTRRCGLRGPNPRDQFLSSRKAACAERCTPKTTAAALDVWLKVMGRTSLLQISLHFDFYRFFNCQQKYCSPKSVVLIIKIKYLV